MMGLVLDVAVAAIGLALSVYILTISFTAVGDEVFKWHTVNIFIASLLEDGAEIMIKTLILTYASGKKDIEMFLLDLYLYFSYWINIDYRLMSFFAIIEVYCLYNRPITYNNLLAKKRWKLYLLLHIISQAICFPYIITDLVMVESVPETIFVVPFHITALTFYLLAIAFTFMALWSIIKLRNHGSGNKTVYTRQMIKFLLYSTPCTLLDLPLHVNSILSLMCALTTSPSASLLTTRHKVEIIGLEISSFRTTVVALCTLISFTSYRRVTIMCLHCQRKSQVTVNVLPREDICYRSDARRKSTFPSLPESQQ